jgi:hypothetical protein
VLLLIAIVAGGDQHDQLRPEASKDHKVRQSFGHMGNIMAVTRQSVVLGALTCEQSRACSYILMTVANLRQQLNNHSHAIICSGQAC